MYNFGGIYSVLKTYRLPYPRNAEGVILQLCNGYVRWHDTVNYYKTRRLCGFYVKIHLYMHIYKHACVLVYMYHVHNHEDPFNFRLGSIDADAYTHMMQYGHGKYINFWKFGMDGFILPIYLLNIHLHLFP